MSQPPLYTAEAAAELKRQATQLAAVIRVLAADNARLHEFNRTLCEEIARIRAEREKAQP